MVCEKTAKLLGAGRFDGKSRRPCMAAAVDQEPGLTGGNDGRSQRNRGIGPPGALADPVFQGNNAPC